MFTIKNDKKNEIIINKSRFITYVLKVDNIYDANKKIEELKKEYKDATHCCYAYIIDNDKRFNDDKEPKSTAGMPILNVLENKQLNHCLAVVIRYFGGIKLGAGGLIRAYSSSVSSAINDDDVIEMKKTYLKRIEFDYSNVNNINYILKDYNIKYKEFDKNVIYEFEYDEDNYPTKIDNFIIKK